MEEEKNAEEEEEGEEEGKGEKGVDPLSGTHLDTRHFLLELPCHPGESTAAARSNHNHINPPCGVWHTHKIISQWTSM